MTDDERAAIPSTQRISSRKVTAAYEKFEQLRDRYLRERGWKHSSDNPGALWLWSKTVGGKSYRCNADTAFAVQEGAETYRRFGVEGYERD